VAVSPGHGAAAAAHVMVVEAPARRLGAGGLRNAVGVMGRRLRQFDVRGANVRARADDIVVEIPKQAAAAQAIAVLGQPGRLYFRPVECTIRAYSGTRRAPARSPANPSAPGASTAQGACGLSPERQGAYLPPHGDRHGDTPEGYDTKDATVVLSYSTAPQHGRYVLGPAEMTGSIVKAAAAVVDGQTGQWQVRLAFTAAGSTKFNHYAARHYACYARRPEDPPNCAFEAFDLDGTLESVPAVMAPSFDGAAVISGPTNGPFTRQEATTIAALVGPGPLPVAFTASVISTVTPARSAAGGT
jgi:preprotein translocase subunit SecD